MNSLLKLLSDDNKIEILRKNWISHDAKAQMAIVREFGWEKGNKLNKEIIKEMGKVMMYRLKNALKISKIQNTDEFIAICSAAVEFYYPPPYMYFEFKIKSEDEMLAVIKKCPIINQVNKIGVTNFYECGCFSLRSGWYKALGLEIEEIVTSCIKNGDAECNIIIKVRKWR